MGKWGIRLLVLAVGIAIFVGVAGFVDLENYFVIESSIEHCEYLGDEGGAQCREEAYSSYRASLDRDGLIALAIGGCAALLFWLLTWLFYFRPRRARSGSS